MPLARRPVPRAALALGSLLALTSPLLVVASTGPATASQSGPCALAPDTAVGPLDAPYYLSSPADLDAVVLFLDYAGARAAASELADVEQAVVGRTAERLSALTHGEVTVDLRPVRRWFSMPGTAASYGLGDVDGEQAAAHLADALEVADPAVDFSGADVVYLVAAPGTPGVDASQASTEYAGDGTTVDGTEIRASVNLAPGFDPGELVVEHETLHLFGLPDLYSTGPDRDAHTGGYDVMGGSVTQPEPFAWQRWQLGHLPDDRVACLALGEERELTLQPLTRDEPGLTTFVIRTGTHTRLVGEYRTTGGLDAGACSTGLLLYRVDDRIESADGPIRVIDARPGTGCGGHGLNDAPLAAPGVHTDPTGARVEVLGLDASGLRVRTSRGAAATAPRVAVSPAVISAGQVVTATWTGQPGQTVEVLSRTQPATAFSVLRTIVLDGAGRATTTHRPQRNTRLTGRTAGTTATGAAPLISVRSVASMRVEAGDVDGTQVVTGRVYPARTGRIVSVYRDGRLLAQGRNDAGGIYRITTRLPAGVTTIQARTGDDTYNLGARSAAETYEIG